MAADEFDELGEPGEQAAENIWNRVVDVSQPLDRVRRAELNADTSGHDAMIRHQLQSGFDTWAAAVVRHRVAVDIWQQLEGAPDGIIIGWSADLRLLVSTISTLQRELQAQLVASRDAIRQARKAVADTVHRMRPDIWLVPSPNFAAQVGAQAELGQYMADTIRFLRLLMKLFAESQPAADDDPFLLL
jgi:hypothetical protein